MPISLGASAIGAITLGTSEVRVSLGDSLIWPNANPPTWAGLTTSDSTSGTAVTLTFMPDGTISGAATSAWLTNTPDTPTAAGYEIRWTTFTSGALTNSTSLTQNTWYPLTNFRIFSMTGTTGIVDKVGNLTIQIRNATTLTPVYSGVWQRTLISNS